MIPHARHRRRTGSFAALLAAAAALVFGAAGAPSASAASKPAAKPAAKKVASKPSAAKAAPKPRRAAPTFSNAYASPRSKERPARKSTQFIILHTTEGGRDGSLAKLRKNGECHYVVDKAGVIYRIVDRRKVAFHCGLSMWNNLRGLDNHAIGIEIVGYHNQDITAAQYASLKYLLADLKRIYKVPDERILTHSMVAFGAPNAFHKRNHRGRKRCGMLLADPARRRKLGLFAKPAYDPDLRAGRLADADPELTRILYPPAKPAPAAKPASPAPAPKPSPAKPPQAPSPAPPATSSGGAAPESNVIGPRRSAWDIARDRYNAPTTVYRFPDGTQRKGSEIRNWTTLPRGTVVLLGDDDDENAPSPVGVLGRNGASARDLAGDEAKAASTFYFRPGAATFARGSALTDAQIDALPAGTRVLVGYTVGGPLSAKKRLFEICGVRWNRPETHYFTPKGTLLTGDAIDERAIPAGTWVFYQE